MKRCPECRRDYYDDSLLYCLDDGSALLEGPASADKAAMLSVPPPVMGGLTQPTALFGEPATAILPHGTQAEPGREFRHSTEKQSFPANRAAKPLLALAVAVVLLIGGFLGYRYFSTINSKQIESIVV